MQELFQPVLAIGLSLQSRPVHLRCTQDVWQINCFIKKVEIRGMKSLPAHSRPLKSAHRDTWNGRGSELHGLFPVADYPVLQLGILGFFSFFL